MNRMQAQRIGLAHAIAVATTKCVPPSSVLAHCSFTRLPTSILALLCLAVLVAYLLLLQPTQPPAA